jgi:glutaminase-like protein
MDLPIRDGFVSTVKRLEPPLDGSPAELLRAPDGLTVELADGQRVRLDPEDPRSPGFAQILDALREQRLPVYLELDRETAGIARLLIPHVARVIGIRPYEGDALAIELDASHALHVLRPDTHDREELEQRLREAERMGSAVVVTETDAHEIIDVRDYTPDPEGPSLPFPKFPPPRQPPTRWLIQPLLALLARLWWWVCLPWWWWFRCLSTTKAQQVFDAMNSTSCAPLTVPAPCIPFLYPDDGCWGRAHEMCRLMINMGLQPGKVWIQGGLHANTRNNPNCYVNWGWHVAPTLCVRGSHFFASQRMVIDPSLFTTPVSETQWKSVQGDPSATLTDTAASDFLWGATDPSYTQTNQVLIFYRLQLQSRSIQYGAPPYANCP